MQDVLERTPTKLFKFIQQWWMDCDNQASVPLFCTVSRDFLKPRTSFGHTIH